MFWFMRKEFVGSYVRLIAASLAYTFSTMCLTHEVRVLTVAASGVHFIALVNVVNLKGNGLGDLGHEQLEWMERDVKGLTASTADRSVRACAAVDRLSAVGLGHRGWRAGAGLFEEVRLGHRAERTHPPGVAKGERARGISRRALHRVDQPAPGTAPSPGPMVVPADELKNHLGIARVSLVSSQAPLVIVDPPFAAV